ncbi:MAG: two-component regulator propeller domain-containing protein, partial [Leadbetterella sp.]
MGFCLFLYFWNCDNKQEIETPITSSVSIDQAPITDFTSQLYFKEYTSKDGLPSTQIWNIYQDRFGYIWIATSEGITRFDGYTFNNYFDNTRTGTRLKMASSFFEDSSGALWVLNGAGFLNKFIRNEDRFEPVKTPFENGWSEQSTHTILEDSLHNFWIGAYGGLQYWDKKRDTILTYPITRIRDAHWPHEEKLRFGKMYPDKRGNIWIGTRKFGFVKFTIASKTYHCYRFDKENNFKILSDWIPDIVPLSDGTLLLSEWDVGLIHFDPVTEKILKVIKLNTLLGESHTINVRDILDEGKGVFSLATDTDGLIVYDFNSNRVLAQYKYNKTSLQGISGNTVRCITKDRMGTHWIGAANLQNASSRFYQFSEFIQDKNDKTSLRNNQIYSLAGTAKNKLLISTENGLSVFDAAKQTFENTIDFALKDEQTYAVLEAKDGTQWISYLDKIVHFEPLKNRVIKSYDTKMVIDDQNNILKRACRMMQDSQGNIWTINNWGRINVIDIKNNTVQQITELSQDPYTKKFVNAFGMIDDPKNNQIMVCTDLGLATITYVDHKVSHKKLTLGTVNHTNDPINYIFRDSSNKIWLLISGKPFIFNPINNSLESIPLTAIYDVESFKWVAESPKGIIWLSCFRGLVKYDVKQNKSAIFFTPNIGDNNLDNTSPVANLNGNIYFSGFKGLTKLEPHKMAPNKGEVRMLIEYLKIPKSNSKLNDKKLLVFDKNQIELPYYQNRFSIKYVGLRFHQATDIKYMYKLVGYDSDWRFAGNNQEATYTNLSPKNYVFQVKSLDNPSNIANIKILINPPFWLRWWAFLIYAGLLYGLIWGIVQSRVQQRLKKIKELEAIRIGISSNLHDDVGTLLSGLAMQSQMLALTTNKEQKEALNEISSMSHEAMERMRDTVWAIDSRKDKYENLVDKMKEFAEKNFHLKQIKHQFETELDDSKKFINPEVRQNIYLIFKEAVTNICKHSNAGHVHILLKQNGSQFLLSIHDNGTPLPINASAGSGLSNMKLRA